MVLKEDSFVFNHMPIKVLNDILHFKPQNLLAYVQTVIERLRHRDTTSDQLLSCHGLSVRRSSFKCNLPTPRLIVPTSSPDVLSAVIHTLSQRVRLIILASFTK